MCAPSVPKVKTAMPSAPALPEEGPQELVVKKDKSTTRRGNPLRIDLATRNAPGAAGANV